MRRIGVVTGTRADYGIFRPILRRIEAEADLRDDALFVTGAHLSPAFGMTVEELKEDRIATEEKVQMLVASDTGEGAALSKGIATMGSGARWLELAWTCCLCSGTASRPRRL